MPKSKKKPKAPPHLRLTCPRIQYDDRTDDLAGHLSRLPPDEGEALVARLVEKNSRCPEANCSCLAPERFRYELAIAAWDRGDHAGCQRHDPGFYRYMTSDCEDDEPRHYEDDYDPYYEWPDDLPCAGVLSEFPVYVDGHHIVYHDRTDRFAQHLYRLTSVECEELTELLCTYFGPEAADQLRLEVCLHALDIGDQELWARQRAKHSQPDSVPSQSELERQLIEMLSGG